jgi:ethanolamine utilization microcompartment shell protein EutS
LEAIGIVLIQTTERGGIETRRCRSASDVKIHLLDVEHGSILVYDYLRLL